MNFLSFLVPSLPLCLPLRFSSSASARKKQRTVEEDIEEESEVMPQTKSARQINLEKKKAAAGTSGTSKKTVARKPKSVSFAKMPDKEYREYREKNPYLIPRQDPMLWIPGFYTNDQEQFINQIYTGQRNAVVLQHRLNIPHMTSPKYQAYFAEAYSMCEEFGLLQIMSEQQDYNEELVGQFYATVHMGNERNAKLHWMIKDEHVECQVVRFLCFVGIPSCPRFQWVDGAS